MIGYTVCYMSALVLVAVLSARLHQADDLGRKLASVAFLAYVVGMLFGAHVLYFNVVEHTFRNESAVRFLSEVGQTSLHPRNLWRLEQSFFIHTGGLWGGPAFALVLLLGTATMLRIPVQRKFHVLDNFARILPIALAVAKLGCFLNGCCYGMEGHGPFTMAFTWAPRTVEGNVRECFPAQLLDMAVYLAIGIALAAVHRRGKTEGRLILWFVLLFSTGRFLTEFTRADNIGGKWFGLSPVQLVLLLSLPPTLLFLRHRTLFTRVLSLRQTEQDPTVKPVRGFGRSFLVVATLVSVLSCLLWLPLMLVFCAIPVTIGFIQWRQIRNDPVALTKLWNAMGYLMLGTLFLTAYLLPMFGWFYVAFVVCWAVLLWLLNATVASLEARE